MAKLALIQTGRVEMLPSRRQQTKVAGVDITAGQVVYEASDTGKWALAKADAAATSTNHRLYVATRNAKAGTALTAVADGEICGIDLTDVDYGAAVYLSADDAGAMVDAAPSAAGNQVIVIGRCTSAIQNLISDAPDKLLDVQTPQSGESTGVMHGDVIGTLTGNVTGNVTGLLDSVGQTAVAAGNSAATATALTKQFAVVSGADAAKGVKLPDKSPCIVVNSDAAILKVYPPTGGNIDAAGVDAAFDQPASKNRLFIKTAAGVWKSVSFAV